MEKKQFLTILGLGNVLLQDEGFGVHFVRWFSGRYHLPDEVDVIEGGTMAYALLDIVCRCEHLIVIDVIKADDEPGSIYRFSQEDMLANMPPPTSAHEVQFMDVLFQAELLDESPETVFLCIVPQKYDEMALTMTALMEEKFMEMERFLLKELALHDVTPERLS